MNWVVTFWLSANLSLQLHIRPPVRPRVMGEEEQTILTFPNWLISRRSTFQVADWMRAYSNANWAIQWLARPISVQARLPPPRPRAPVLVPGSCWWSTLSYCNTSKNYPPSKVRMRVQNEREGESKLCSVRRDLSKPMTLPILPLLNYSSLAFLIVFNLGFVMSQLSFQTLTIY